MANAKKCDRCGRLYDCYQGVPMTPLGNKYNGIAITSDITHASCYDLCPPCMTSFRVWFGYDDIKPDENKEGDYEAN